MKPSEKLWLLKSNIDEPFEDWVSPVAVFRSLEALNKYVEENPPYDDGEYEKYYYMDPEEIDFFYN